MQQIAVNYSAKPATTARHMPDKGQVWQTKQTDSSHWATEILQNNTLRSKTINKDWTPIICNLWALIRIGFEQSYTIFVSLKRCFFASYSRMVAHTCFGVRWNPGVLPLGKCFWQISLKRCLYVKSWRKRTTFFLFWSRVGPPEHRIVPLRPYLGHFEARNWHIGHKWLQLLQMGWTLVKMGWAPEMTNSGPKLPYWP